MEVQQGDAMKEEGSTSSAFDAQAALKAVKSSEGMIAFAVSVPTCGMVAPEGQVAFDVPLFANGKIPVTD